MLIIENNRNPDNTPTIYDATCPHCKSKLKYVSADIHMFYTGNSQTDYDYLLCPCCYEKIKLEPDPMQPIYPPPYLCEECGENFDTELYIGSNGSLFAKCPYCDEEQWIGEGVTLTEENINYPQHFFQYGRKSQSSISDAQITEWVRKCVARLDKDVDYSMSASGDTIVIAAKTEEDSNTVSVYVCKGYSECELEISSDRY